MRTLVVRLDSIGDVLLAGPCIRAVAAGSDRVTVLAGPRGRAAADLLPGVDEVLEWCAPWIDPEPPPVRDADITSTIARIRERGFDRALILTSFHQSPLPTALMLRQAGIGWIGAISEDYPGSLLDLRHRVSGDPPEAERALSLATAAGFALDPGDDGRLALAERLPDASALVGDRESSSSDSGRADSDRADSDRSEPYVVVHPGASVPARAPSVRWSARLVAALAESGDHRVVVTGGPDETELTATVAADHALDLGGRTSLPMLAAVLRDAAVVVAPNTGAAHVAAAVRTPVVSLFAPVVPALRWAPYGVPTALLGDQHAACRDTRARVCPVPGHPCLDRVDVRAAVAAVAELAGEQVPQVPPGTSLIAG